MGSTRLSAVKTPKGPSTKTRVPTGIFPSLALWSPRFLTVIRNDSPVGASESENGCFVYQKPSARKRQKKNCPALGSEPFEAPAADP